MIVKLTILKYEFYSEGTYIFLIKYAPNQEFQY